MSATPPHSDGDSGASPVPSDEELVARARARDPAAFEELVARHEDRLYRAAVRLLRNDNDAREVLQEGLLSAWRRLDSFHGQSQFGSWLYRVVVNSALMLLRSRRRHPAVSVEDLPPGTLDEATSVDGGGAGGHWSKRPGEHFQSA